MSYAITKSTDLDFAHIVPGHSGHCINVHGHTWKFEVTLTTNRLDANGFVVDFAVLKRTVLRPVHDFLDHSLLLPDRLVTAGSAALQGLMLLASGIFEDYALSNGGEPHEQLMDEAPSIGTTIPVCGIRDLTCGGLKVRVADFDPTSERLAEWLYNFAAVALRPAFVGRDFGVVARVYETLHPVKAVAAFHGPIKFIPPHG